MADKKQEIPNPDAPNDDIEALSPDEEAALADRSTIAQARKEEEAAIIAETEQEPEPQAQEAPKPAAEAQPEQKPEGKVVPLASLLEERKEWQRKIDEESQKRAELAGKLDLINQRLNQPKPQEPAKPLDVDANPIEALKQTRQQLEQVQQAQQVAFQRQQFAQHVAAEVQSFKAKTEDYDAAYRYLRDGRIAELSAMGLPQSQIAAQLEQDEFGISAMALQSGENPGARLYKIAQARGYKKAEAPPQQQAQPVTAEQRIETANRGQANAKSLSGGGSPPPAKITLSDIEKMSEDEIAAMSDDKFRALFGA